MKLCPDCLNEDELICDFCKHVPLDKDVDADMYGLCKKLDKEINLIDQACNDFECFLRDKEENQEGLF